MSKSDYISIASLLVALFALLVSTVPIIIDRKKRYRERIAFFRTAFIETSWHNEGDINPSTPYFYKLKLSPYSGYRKLVGSLIIGGIEDDFIFYGTISPNGQVTGILNATLGWREFKIAKVSFEYDEDHEQITMKTLKIFNKGEEHFAQQNYVDKLKEKVTLWKYEQ